MFTSRAEYRLSLREDNADERLTETGRELGLVDDTRWDAFNRKRDAVARELERLKTTWVNPRILGDDESARVFGKPIEREYTLLDLLKRPEVSYDQLLTLRAADGAALGGPPADGADDPQAAGQVEIRVKYAGYIARQQDEVARHESAETTRIPADLDYAQVRGLSHEVRQKLARQRPETIGQASRISGITPAAISLLIVHVKRLNRAGGGAERSAA
jgi:tRNA uridine 5-carboxymethylaminomethyl modification enzyme